MNWQYKADEARLYLDAYIQGAMQKAQDPLLGSLPVEDYAVVEFSEPPCMRLVPQNAQVGEEVTVVVPGILCSKTLPPVYGPLRSTRPEHVRYLRQYVRCTGLGSATFSGFQSQLNDIYEKFANAPGVNTIKNFDFGLYEGEYCISMHTRHLTDRRYVSGERHIPFPPEIDPNHVLEEARDTQFIRIEDNVVQYSKRIEAPDGTFYFEPLPPAEFKEGDIVEATGAFVAYPGGEQGEYKLVFCLRALTMICSQYREDSKKKVTVHREEEPRKRSKVPSPSKIKRRYIPYGPPTITSSENSKT